MHDLLLLLWVDVFKQTGLSLQLIDLNLLYLQLTLKDLHHKHTSSVIIYN